MGYCVYDLSEEDIQKTIETWQPYYKQPLTEQDALEIHRNVVGLFSILLEWDMKQKEAEKIQNSG